MIIGSIVELNRVCEEIEASGISLSLQDILTISSMIENSEHESLEELLKELSR